MLEGTGLAANSLWLFGGYSGKDLHYVYPNGDEVSAVDQVYGCSDYSGELRCQPGDEYRLELYVPREIPEDIHPPHKCQIKEWAARRTGVVNRTVQMEVRKNDP